MGEHKRRVEAKLNAGTSKDPFVSLELLVRLSVKDKIRDAHDFTVMRCQAAGTPSPSFRDFMVVLLAQGLAAFIATREELEASERLIEPATMMPPPGVLLGGRG